MQDKLRYNHPQLFKTVVLYIAWAAYTGGVFIFSQKNGFDVFCGVILVTGAMIMGIGLMSKYTVSRIGFAIVLAASIMRILLFGTGTMNHYRFWIVIGFWAFLICHILIVMLEPPKNPLTKRNS